MSSINLMRANKVMPENLDAAAACFDARAEFDRLRNLVPERADFHLHNWGVWRRGGTVTEGYSDHVPGMCAGGRCVAEEASDHDFDDQMVYAAEVADAIICGMDIHYRATISNVYEAKVLKVRSTVTTDQALINAAGVFWQLAAKRGLT